MRKRLLANHNLDKMPKSVDAHAHLFARDTTLYKDPPHEPFQVARWVLEQKLPKQLLRKQFLDLLQLFRCATEELEESKVHKLFAG
jgi:hypothetical protein